ncbi:MAG TPA: hypothetical protein VIQ78_03755, partial [Terrimesophilobacter sp.]|uniref:hypothetical protein n=1 Tax=Terrimesophilobacter sp. TaxID=2906435 RepID=UPI002F923BCD
IATVALLSGCVPQEPVITPEPEPSSTPVFASDEEALAAATDAYAKYLEGSDQIAHDGGAGADRITSYLTTAQAAKELETFAQLKESGRSTQGATTFDKVRLQQYEKSPQGTDVVVVYLCLDVSAVEVQDAKGKDVTPSDRTNRLPLEVGFEASDSSRLLISRSEPWSGSDFCM